MQKVFFVLAHASLNSSCEVATIKVANDESSFKTEQ
jgi:hypothetical protein